MATFLIKVFLRILFFKFCENTIWESIKTFAPTKPQFKGGVQSVQPFNSYKVSDLNRVHIIAAKYGLKDFNNYFNNNPNNSIADYANLKGVHDFSDAFESYQKRFQRNYKSDESAIRQMQTLVSLLDIKNNIENFGITSLTDRTFDEYNNRLGINIPSEEYEKIEFNNEFLKRIKRSAGPLPLSFDWGEKGVVLPVEDQGECMSCWAFSLTSSIESHKAIKYGKKKLRRLSVQQLLDCVHDGGCKVGFWPKDAVNNILDKRDGLIASEDSYPYLFPPKTYSCHLTSDNPTKIKGFVSLPKNSKDEVVMRALYDNGPLVVVLRFDAFQNYRKGVIFDKEECKEVGTHAVTLIGWGVTNNGKKYWLIKNSFGNDWGEGGYLKVSRGANVCLLKKWIIYPLID